MYCAECKKECNPIEIDVGYGAYEFWGARGNDVRLVEVSDCCEADLLDDLPEEEPEDEEEEEHDNEPLPTPT